MLFNLCSDLSNRWGSLIKCKAHVTPFRASYGEQFLLPAVPHKKHASVSISHGPRADLPASLHASPICPQTSFDHARNFVRVSCWYLHADVITKHQQKARKDRNLIVHNPLKENRLAVDLWPSRTSACQLRSYCEQGKVFVLQTCVCTGIYADMGRSIRGCWG